MNDMTDIEIVKNLILAGLAQYTYEDGSDEPTGWRLTQQGVEVTDKMFPEIPAHESYFQ